MPFKAQREKSNSLNKAWQREDNLSISPTTHLRKNIYKSHYFICKPQCGHVTC